MSKKKIGVDFSLIGKKYNRLTIIDIFKKELNSGQKIVICKCVCECGKVIETRKDPLVSGKIISCGCFRYERLKEKVTKHGMAGKELYMRWAKMKQRCYGNWHKEFYKNKGIIVCEDWKENYLSFERWAIDNGYKKELTLDRIDNDGNYEPSNCRWVDYKVQTNNRSVTIFLIDSNGIRKPLSEWCDIYNVSYDLASTRHDRGWEFDDIFRSVKHMHRNKK